MEEKESIYYVIMLAVALFIVPGGGDNLMNLLTLAASVLLAIAIILIAVKNIPFFGPYIADLGDNIIKLLAWIGILVIGVLVIIGNVLNTFPG